MVKISIYDAAGAVAATLVNEEMKAGEYEINWDASSYSSGVYFYSIVTKKFTETKRMVLLK